MSVTRGIHVLRARERLREIHAFADVTGGRVGLTGVLGHLTHRARASSLGARLGRAVDQAIAFDEVDSRDPRWWPQGVSSAAAARPDGPAHGRRLLVLTWYSRAVAGTAYGSRVTFLDLDSLRYRHVLLVLPRLDEAGRLVLDPLGVHAGGIVWAGDYLHIAATRAGIVSCHLDDIMAVDGHHFVLPVRRRYHGHTDGEHEKLRFSFLSLDPETEPATLLAGEYGRGGQTTRIARFAAGRATGQLLTGDDGASRPVSLDDGGVLQMQGAVVARGRHHITVSQGPWTPGSVYVGAPQDLRRHGFATPMGPEDIDYDPLDDLLWSVTEHPGRRWVFSMRRSWFD